MTFRTISVREITTAYPHGDMACCALIVTELAYIEMEMGVRRRKVNGPLDSPKMRRVCARRNLR